MSRNGPWGFRPGLTPNRLSPEEDRKLEILDFSEVETKGLISCAVTAQLTCAFVFEYAQILFKSERKVCCL